MTPNAFWRYFLGSQIFSRTRNFSTFYHSHSEASTVYIEMGVFGCRYLCFLGERLCIYRFFLAYRLCGPAWPPLCSGWWSRWWWPGLSHLSAISAVFLGTQSDIKKLVFNKLLKVDGNEKWPGSKRRQKLNFSPALWRSRLICHLNMQFLC